MKSRPYEMRARAAAAAETAERILDAVERLFWETPDGEPTLEAIASAAGVSVQTVIRRFGGREGAEAAAFARAAGRVADQRGEARSGDLPGAVTVLVAHYEALGDGVVRMLASEHQRPFVAQVAVNGRRMHEAWCEQVFAPTLNSLTGVARARRLAQLMAVCDVGTWKVLRRDRKLSRKQVELALLELLEPLTSGA
jgi:AcrR family transcriptional regulator